MDKTQELASGGGETFEEVERLCTDIRDETQDDREEVAEALKKRQIRQAARGRHICP